MPDLFPRLPPYSVRAYRKAYPGSLQARDGAASRPIFGRQSKNTEGPDTAFAFLATLPEEKDAFLDGRPKMHEALARCSSLFGLSACIKHGAS